MSLLLWIQDDGGEKTNRNQQWSESLCFLSRGRYWCVMRRNTNALFLKNNKKKKNIVPRSLPCWYLWVDVTKPLQCSFTNKHCAEHFEPQREKQREYFLLFPSFFPVSFLSLPSKSSHRGQCQFPSHLTPREREHDRSSAWNARERGEILGQRAAKLTHSGGGGGNAIHL